VLRRTLLFALIITAACDEPRRSTGPVSPRQSGGDAGTVSGTDAGGMSSPNQACLDMLEALCARTQHCSSRIGFVAAIIEGSMCHPARQTAVCAQATAAQTAGRQRIDEAAVRQCATNIRNSSCSEVTQSSACDGAAVGLKANGEQCYENADCMAGRCDTSSACPGTCVVLGMAGADCEDNPDCASDYCNDSRKCAAKSTTGGPCTRNSGCASDGVCVNSTCAARAPVGQSCTGAFDNQGSCVDDAWCQDAAGGRCMSMACTCAAMGGTGSACDVGFDGPTCSGELLCVNSTCAPGGAAGAMCGQDTPCAVGFRCAGDTSPTCHPVKKPGESCTTRGQCPALFYCDSVCKPGRVAGESCSETDVCIQGTCSSGTCTRAEVGQPCNDSSLGDELSSCVVGAHCHQGACVAIIPLGGDCSGAGADCGPAASCRGGVCVAECQAP